MLFSLLCLPVGISVYMSDCHCVWLSACVPVCLCTFPPVHMSSCLRVCPVNMHACLPTCLPVYMSAFFCVCLWTCLPVYMSAWIQTSVCMSRMETFSPCLLTVSLHVCLYNNLSVACLQVYMSTCRSACLSTTQYIYKSPKYCLLFRRKPSIAQCFFSPKKLRLRKVSLLCDTCCTNTRT